MREVPRRGGGREKHLSPSQKSKISASPAGPAPLLSALRTFSPLTGKSALVRGGLMGTIAIKIKF